LEQLGIQRVGAIVDAQGVIALFSAVLETFDEYRVVQEEREMSS